MKKIAALLTVLSVALTGYGQTRTESVVFDVQANNNIRVSHKAYSGIVISGTVTDSVASAYVDLTGETGTLAFKRNLSDTNFLAQSTIALTTPTQGKFTATFPIADFATNITVKTRYWGDVRFSTPGNVLPSIELWLYPSANQGNEASYVSPTLAQFQTNGTQVTPLTIIDFGSGITGTHDGTNKLTLTVASSAGGDLTEVQVSGSILTVASGTGPIPIVGLTTAAVQAAQSAETDPVWGAVSNSVTSDIDAIEAKTNTWNNAVQKDGDTMTGNLAFTEGVVVGDIVFKPVIGTTDAAEDVSFGQFSAGGYGIDGPYMVVRKTGHASNPNGIDFVVPSSKAIRYLYGFGTVGAIISNGVVSADEFVGGGVSLTGITSNSIAAATDTAYRSGGTTYTAGTNLDLIGGTDFNLDSSAVASLALADSALQSEVQDIAAVVALDGDIGTGNITSAAGGTTLDMSSGKFYSSGGTVDISGGTGPALSGSAFSASIDATTGNQIVGWSVLTNQIALLAPAGGGATPAFTNAAGNTYSVADLSGAQDGNGIVYSFTLGGWTNSANRVMQNGDSPTALDATAWRTLYSDGSGNITELAFGTSGQHLKSNGASSAPTWETPSAGGGSQTPWTNNVDAAGFALTALDYTSMNTNAAAVTGVAGKLVQYILNDRLYSVYDSVTNYAVLN